MLKISDITYAIEGRRLFEGATSAIPTGHKVGIVGANGTGKTTLFRLISEDAALESGTIELPKNVRIGGVAQEAPASSTSLIETVLAHDTERAALLAEVTDDPNRIAAIQARLSDIDAWSAEARGAAILKGLGFDEAAQGRPCSDFSGGWRMRVALAGVLFSAPDLLLLDEPTNYLDLEGSIWLETFLTKYPHTVLIISHDRGLLNRSVGAILHLEARKLTLYQGAYDNFVRTRQARRAAQAAVAAKQETQRAHMQKFINRFMAKATKSKQAQSRVKALARMERITPPEEAARQIFTFPQPDALSPPIMRMEDTTVGYGNRSVLHHLNLRIDQDDRIALLGRNGEGKSTLSKLIAERLPPMDGTITKARKLRVGYFAQHQVDELALEQTPLEHLQALRPDTPPTQLRARLAGFGLGANQADTCVSNLSGGQKARLSLLLATLDAPHMLVLDEPTNHLDIESREALVEALTANGGAVILVSHDMHLLSLVADRLWLVSGGRVTPYEHDLESYRASLLAGKPARNRKGKAKSEKPAKSNRDTLLGCQTEVRKCEERLEKLHAMSDKLAQKLADPMLYTPAQAADRMVWQKKSTEVKEAIDRAEELWLQATEKLESSTSQCP